MTTVSSPESPTDPMEHIEILPTLKSNMSALGLLFDLCFCEPDKGRLRPMGNAEIYRAQAAQRPLGLRPESARTGILSPLLAAKSLAFAQKCTGDDTSQIRA